MTISQSQGLRVIPEVAAKQEIKKIIDRNPAIKAAVDRLVAASSETTEDEKRNHSIREVYVQNYVFGREVDRKLDGL